MAEVSELRLVPNRSGSMSLDVVWTNLDVTSVITQKDHMESCPVDEHMESCPVYKIKNRAVLKKRSAEETKPIPAIYDEQVSTASAAPSTSGHFPLFKRVKSTMYSHREKGYQKCLNLQIPDAFRTTQAGEDLFL
ncbi:hypothetical protein T11_7562 [Trichinella zimbabwensis]|uniref:Uncharacterized protein n=1 Tax=Trichinella zimbabwensis TaxID=268475 RepID=A0A0V1GNV6_9BILA|nr:hypothetical protein T11_7562 [Trichinella zimbabwensis]